MLQVKVRLYDTFSGEVFCGNQAAVVTQPGDLTDEQMQNIARELCAPVTCFVFRKGKDSYGSRSHLYALRFFDKDRELDFSGHGLIATFKALADGGRIRCKQTKDKVELKVRVRIGDIPVEILFVNKKPVYVMMSQRPPSYELCHLKTPEIADMLGLETYDILEDHPTEVVVTSLRHLIVPLESHDSLKRVNPNFGHLDEVCGLLKIQSVNMFTQETVQSGYHVHCRDFTTRRAHREESASGTANGALSCYLVKNKIVVPKKDGPLVILAEQGQFLNRPSSIRTQLQVSGQRVEQLMVGGTAVKVMTGVMLVK